MHQSVVRLERQQRQSLAYFIGHRNIDVGNGAQRQVISVETVWPSALDARYLIEERAEKIKRRSGDEQKRKLRRMLI